MKSFRYTSRDGETEVLIGVDFIEALKRLKDDYSGCVVIASNVFRNRLKLDMPTLFINDGEEGKSIENVIAIVKWAYEDVGLDRDGLFVGIGGGSVLDVVGFTASIYLRGVDYVNVPTTMLAMVDASLGGKTGVNALGLKNVIGVIKQPKAIIIDLKFLDSLPERSYTDGYAEVIKYGVTLDKALFEYVYDNADRLKARKRDLLEYVIYKSLKDKAEIVMKDELDRLGIRAVLNYGHTIGHAIESLTNFGVSHGRAVALGMLCEARIGVRLGYTRKDVVDALKEALDRFGLLDVSVRLGDVGTIAKLVTKDKKRSGEHVRIPVVTELGEWTLVRIPVRRFAELACSLCEELP